MGGYRGPGPLVAAHVIHVQLGLPPQLLFGRLGGCVHGRGVSPPPRHNFVVDLLAAGLLECLGKQESMSADMGGGG